MRYLYALALVPFAAFANPLETDFDQVFADNEATVLEQDGVSQVELAGKILLSRTPEGKFFALDGSPHEAVGCVLSITLQTRAASKICPESLTPEQEAVIERNIDDLAAFYAANNVPARPVADVRGGLDAVMSTLTDRLANLECTPEDVGKFKQFIDILTNDDAQARLSASLADARLPVTRPCQ